jgi:hypothetical protein
MSDRWLDELISVHTSLTHLEIPHDFLDQYLVLIKKWVPLVLAELIFNVDECGFSDWEERNKRLCSHLRAQKPSHYTIQWTAGFVIKH